MTYQELFSKVLERERNYAMIDILIMEMDSRNSPGWKGAKMEASIVPDFWNTICEELMFWCVHMSNGTVEVDKHYYGYATEVAETFRQVLNAEFGADLAEVKIISPCEIAAQDGVVSITENADGNRVVSLTEKGEKLVRK